MVLEEEVTAEGLLHLDVRLEPGKLDALLNRPRKHGACRVYIEPVFLAGREAGQ